MVILVCWMIWKERNNRTFDRTTRTLQEVLVRVVDEIVAWFQTGFSKLEPVVQALGRSPGRQVTNNVITGGVSVCRVGSFSL